jgi:hypothetical protein
LFQVGMQSTVAGHFILSHEVLSHGGGVGTGMGGGESARAYDPRKIRDAMIAADDFI